jgi:ArsR family transcriptional regulator, arsenate/arsenite/antimonite-responsive transcriptional repressor
MKHSLDSYSDALAALGHDARLCIFRLLVRAGDNGLNVGDLVAGTDLPASTLSHHLRTLVSSGLVVQERDGREVTSRVDFDAMKQTISFLTSECCTGVTLVKQTAA